MSHFLTMLKIITNMQMQPIKFVDFYNYNHKLKKYFLQTISIKIVMLHLSKDSMKCIYSLPLTRCTITCIEVDNKLHQKDVFQTWNETNNIYI